ncbi:MAG TPA: hypothetical protein VLA93_15370 [Pyrinomonadaceae bacterium]|nr:hypothetical protein [Pyrinomonadaceae bacterium]
MRPARPNSLQNPFKNRFNDPVTWRLDEMQAHSNVIWPRQRTHGVHGDHASPADRRSVRHHEITVRRVPSVAVDEKFVERSEATSDVGMYASVLTFFVVLLASAIVLFRAL